ncbi:hypothetical protein [Limnohabitans sp. Rim8]|uniref:hypothetical protein n=1 Tax=Limnohabitans sp. Rim8 TaxID=1100718 RepID=UPI003305CF5C
MQVSIYGAGIFTGDWSTLRLGERTQRSELDSAYLGAAAPEVYAPPLGASFGTGLAYDFPFSEATPPV